MWTASSAWAPTLSMAIRSAAILRCAHDHDALLALGRAQSGRTTFHWSLHAKSAGASSSVAMPELPPARKSADAGHRESSVPAVAPARRPAAAESVDAYPTTRRSGCARPKHSRAVVQSTNRESPPHLRMPHLPTPLREALRPSAQLEPHRAQALPWCGTQ